MKYYAKCYDDHLVHHGILGQKWGHRNGPPYPLSADDHSSAEKKLNKASDLDNYGTKSHAGRKRYQDTNSSFKNQNDVVNYSKKFSINSKYVKAAIAVGAAAAVGYGVYKIASSNKQDFKSVDSDTNSSFKKQVEVSDDIEDYWKKNYEGMNKAVDNPVNQNYYKEIKKNSDFKSFDDIPKLEKDDRPISEQIKDMIGLNNDGKNIVNPKLQELVDDGFNITTGGWESSAKYEAAKKSMVEI